MRPTLLQIDEFAPDAQAVRDAVIAKGFATEQGPDRLPYTGISRYNVPHWHALLMEVLGRDIHVKLSCFRLNIAGELPHSWVHSDEVCDASWAGVLYLNTPEQCRGGTAFWRHAGLGLEELPVGESQAFYGMMNREWRELSSWEQTSLVGMKFNRFCTYPTSFFHSRYPFQGFGSGPADGRLIWAVFYD